MYNKISGGWLKHWDFMLLDMIFLQAAYIFSYMVRNGINNPYENRIYLNIGIFICMIDLCASFFLEGYRGIMRRDGFMEFKAVIKHVFTVCIFVLAYLFRVYITGKIGGVTGDVMGAGSELAEIFLLILVLIITRFAGFPAGLYGVF